MSRFLFFLEAKLAAGFLRLLKLTLGFEIINRNPDEQKCIYMFWHRNLLLLCLHRIGSPVAVVISASKDGELIAGPVKELGFIPVRGSSSRQGAKALKEMIQHGRRRQLAITPDGPKGPPKSIHPGVFQIALLAKIPIIPISANVNREWVFNSWDRFRVPKPFAKIKVIYGKPFYVEDKESIAGVTEEIKLYAEELERECSI